MATTIYTCGQQHKIAKMVDDGITVVKTDVSPAVPDTTPLMALSFDTDLLGIVVGTNGKAYHTVDGGVNWTTPVGLGVEDYFDVWHGDSSTVYVAGSVNVYKSIDGGLNFVVTGSQPASGGPYSALKFLDANIGVVAAQSGAVWHTSNGGTSWTLYPFTPSLNSPTEIFLFSTNGLNDVYIITPTEFFRGNLLGATIVLIPWTTTVVPPLFGSAPIAGGWFPSELVGYVCGVGGALARTADAGATWAYLGPASPGTGTRFTSYFTTVNNGYTSNQEDLFNTIDGHVTEAVYLDTSVEFAWTNEMWLEDVQAIVDPPIPGCTNPLATNYNPLATIDDGSCILPPDCSYFNVNISEAACAPDCIAPGELITFDVCGTIDPAFYPTQITFCLYDVATNTIVQQYVSPIINDDLELCALQFVFTINDPGKYRIEVCIPGCNNRRVLAFDICDPFDVYKDDCNQYHIHRPHESLYSVFNVTVTEFGETTPIVTDDPWDITLNNEYKFTVTGDGIWIIDLKDPATGAIIHQFVRFELCQLLDCLRKLINILFCSGDEPCCTTCDKDAQDLNSYARITFNRLQPLYFLYLSLAKKYGYDNVGYNIIDQERFEYLTRADEVLDNINELTSDCSGICPEVTLTSATSAGGCASC